MSSIYELHKTGETTWALRPGMCGWAITIFGGVEVILCKEDGYGKEGQPFYCGKDGFQANVLLAVSRDDAKAICKEINEALWVSVPDLQNAKTITWLPEESCTKIQKQKHDDLRTELLTYIWKSRVDMHSSMRSYPIDAEKEASRCGELVDAIMAKIEVGTT